MMAFSTERVEALSASSEAARIAAARTLPSGCETLSSATGSSFTKPSAPMESSAPAATSGSPDCRKPTRISFAFSTIAASLKLPSASARSPTTAGFGSS